MIRLKCKTQRNQDNNGRQENYTGYRRDVGKRAIQEDDQKALVVQDISGIGKYDWSYLVPEEETTNFALMASNTASSTTEVNSCSQKCIESYNQLKKLYDEQIV